MRTNNKEITIVANEGKRARKEARKIIKTHKPTPLNDDVKKTLREVVEAAEKALITTW